MKNNHIYNTNTINENNTYITMPPPTNDEKAPNKFINKRLIVAILISFISIFSISITISLVVNKDNQLLEVVENDENHTIIVSDNYYTETVVHGTKDNMVDAQHPVIKIVTPLYENVITYDLSYDNNGDFIKTTKATQIKIADITHIYYPNSEEYSEKSKEYLY